MLTRLKIWLRIFRWLPTIAKATQPKYTTANLIEKRVAESGDDVFIDFEGREVSYNQFNAKANQVAHWGIAQGLKHNDVVALLMDNRPEFLFVWAGLAKIGVTTALLNNNLEGKSLAHVVEAANSRMLIAGDECVESWMSLGEDKPENVPVAVWPQQADAILPPGTANLTDILPSLSETNPDASVRSELSGNDPLFYIYTSGTTGLPKAAKFSHSRFWGAGSYHFFSGIKKSDAIYCCLPLYHTVGGVICVNACLQTGAKLVLRRKFSASRFWKDVTESGATVFQYIGELCRYLVQQPPGDYDKKHNIRYCVGNGMRPDVWPEFEKRFGIDRVIEFYGSTEGNITLVNLEAVTGSIGKPMLGLKTFLAKFDVENEELIRDANGRCIECGPDEPGEMLGLIKSGVAGGFEGYTSKEATEKKIATDVVKEGDRWFRSGDLLKRDKSGSYYFVDRIGDTFRWKGENVSTQEVAEAASGDDCVELATVYGVEVPNTDGRAGMASLTLRAGASFDPKRFFNAISSLPGYARPAFVRVDEAIEMTGTFKVRKVELQKDGYDPAVIGTPLFYRDDKSETYTTLDSSAFERINSGEIRL